MSDLLEKSIEKGIKQGEGWDLFLNCAQGVFDYIHFEWDCGVVDVVVVVVVE